MNKTNDVKIDMLVEALIHEFTYQTYKLNGLENGYGRDLVTEEVYQVFRGNYQSEFVKKFKTSLYKKSG